MKKLLFSSLILSVSLLSCDKIEDPTKDVVAISASRKVMVEDYTGQACGNCPEASAVMDSLIKYFPDNVVPVTVHAGWFADTLAQNHDFNGVELATREGNYLDSVYAISAFGNPNGMVDRVKKDERFVRPHTEWSSIVNNKLELFPEANFILEMSSDFNSSNRKMNLTVSGLTINDTAGVFNVSVLITENNIIAPQKFYAGILGRPAGWDENFVHKHVLRTYVDGVNGTKVFEDPIASQKFEENYSFVLPSNWNADECHVVAFIYNTETKEIFQTEEVSVK
jgi:hypothetical protein